MTEGQDREAVVRAYLWEHRRMLTRVARATIFRYGLQGTAVDDAAEVALSRARDCAGKCMGEVTPWVAGVAKNVAKEWRRRQAVVDRVEGFLRWCGLLDSEGRYDVGSGRTRSRGDAERLMMGAELLDVLDPQTREIYVARHRDGETLREIGERVGMPLTTVESRLKSAQKRIDEARSPGRTKVRP